MELAAAGEDMKKLREIARTHIEKAAALGPAGDDVFDIDPRRCRDRAADALTLHTQRERRQTLHAVEERYPLGCGPGHRLSRPPPCLCI